MAMGTQLAFTATGIFADGTTRDVTALERMRRLVLRRYLADLDALGRLLSISRRRVDDPAALAELERGKGSFYDPAVVETVARMVRETAYKLPT